MFRPTAAHRGAPVVTPASRERAKSPGLRRAAWACVFGILAVFALGGSAWAQAPESDPPAGDAPADEIRHFVQQQPEYKAQAYVTSAALQERLSRAWGGLKRP